MSSRTKSLCSNFIWSSGIMERTCMLFNLLQLVLSACVGDVKCRPVLHQCVMIFSGPLGSWNVCCWHLKIESVHALGSVSSVASFIAIYEQLQFNGGCYILHAHSAFRDFPFFSYYLLNWFLHKKHSKTTNFFIKNKEETKPCLNTQKSTVVCNRTIYALLISPQIVESKQRLILYYLQKSKSNIALYQGFFRMIVL